MKNKIEFPKKEAIQIRQLINQANSECSFDENQKTEVEGIQRIKASKIIKGKVKVYNSKDKMKFVNSDFLDDEAELDIVSKRMSLFLKLTFLMLIVISVLIFFKKNAL